MIYICLLIKDSSITSPKGPKYCSLLGSKRLKLQRPPNPPPHSFFFLPPNSSNGVFLENKTKTHASLHAALCRHTSILKGCCRIYIYIYIAYPIEIIRVSFVFFLFLSFFKAFSLVILGFLRYYAVLMTTFLIFSLNLKNQLIFYFYFPFIVLFK